MEKKDMQKQRRRLSTVSDNALVEGVENLDVKSTSPPKSSTVSTADTRSGAGGGGDFIVNSYGGFSKKGYAPYNPKKKNQDALVMAEDPKTRSLLLAVMDGHGEDGDKVSQAMKGKLASYMFRHPGFGKSLEEGVKEAFVDVVSRLETEVLRDVSIETDFSGTTFTAAVIRGNRCITCNVGDSRTSIGFSSSPITGEAITEDHKPDLPDEKRRIEATGGRVFAVEYEDGVDGPPRVWLGHMDVPGLAMSRSIGDVVAHSAGVSSEPEFKMYTFNQGREDIILVMASDGLWEFVTDQEAMAIAYNTSEPRFAVDKLINEAHDRWMREEQVVDDTTVCVAFLGSFKGSK